jgi:hypothetical protein
VTGGRPERLETPLGVFEFRHDKPELLRGYRMTDLHSPKHPTQRALVAVPEKALLDLIYLQPGSDSPEYLNELRLQNLERLDLNALRSLAALYRLPKMQRAYEHVIRLAQTEAEEFETL